MTETIRQVRNKPVASYTLDAEVIEKVDTIAKGLGISNSALVNMQLRIALGMVDAETSDFMNRGTKTRLTAEGFNEK